MVESTWRELCKKIMGEKDPETDDAGGGAQQRIGPTRTGIAIETAAVRCETVNAKANDWITLVMRSAILLRKS